MGVQEVRWDKGCTEQGIIFFSMEREAKIVSWEQVFFVHHRKVSAVKREVFVSDRMSYIILRGHWCNVIVLKVHAQSEEKSDDSKDSFHEILEQVFLSFS